jgi:hypothetical protein
VGTILNITNGDAAVEVMKAARVPGDFLPWRDVLHEGPVPADLTLNALSEVRAQFIIDSGWGNAETVKRDFIQRDRQLASCAEYDKVILWFEHDLYDQLQLLQILDWFADNSSQNTKLTIICTEQYLGPSTPEQLKALYPYETPVTEHHLKIAKHAWTAFRASSPEPLLDLLSRDLSVLPFLEGALRRLLEEYPSCKNGLSRTAQTALEIIAQGESRPGRIFGAYQQSEERRFMGDTSFWAILHQLLDSQPPLLTLPPGKELTLPTSADQALTLTSAGRAVMNEDKSWLNIHRIDRWIGGVHLTPETIWCWDAGAGKLLKKE